MINKLIMMSMFFPTAYIWSFLLVETAEPRASMFQVNNRETKKIC